MKTIALRFTENFSPKCGTISAHQEIIDRKGFVWYGKLGKAISKNLQDEILENDNPKILLIKCGDTEVYWAYIDIIQDTTPELNEVPEYYRNRSENIMCWFRITKFEKVSEKVLSECKIISSGKILGEVYKHCMTTYYRIEAK